MAISFQVGPKETATPGLQQPDVNDRIPATKTAALGRAVTGGVMDEKCCCVVGTCSEPPSYSLATKTGND